MSHEPLIVSESQVVTGRRPRRTRPMFKVTLVWLFLMAIVAGLVQWSRSRDVKAASAKGGKGTAQSQTDNFDANQKFIEQVLPECRETLASMLTAESIAQRLPLVIPHPDIARRMERHYKDSTLINTDPQALTLIASTLVDLPEGKTVLTQWETAEGATFDAAFRNVNHKWALDWNHFVRYSDLLWPVFLAGSGEDVAEFRLYARRRLASEDDPHNGIGVVLSAPMRRHMREAGYSQSMAGLSLNERDGKLLQEALNREAAGFPLFGAAFRDINPDGMIRVRVRVRRIGDEGGFKYRIEEVLACHWYDSKATGFDLMESSGKPDEN